MSWPTPERLREAVRDIGARVTLIAAETSGGQKSERDLWHELACCILSSQVTYESALAATNRLDWLGLLWRKGKLSRAGGKSIEGVLAKPVKVGDRWVSYRFPRSRGMQLNQAMTLIRRRHGTLTNLLAEIQNPIELRKYLVSNVAGLGPKQASMFIRNIGAGYELAVIDRHVLRYMAILGMWRSASPPPVRLSAYETRERDLRVHAMDAGLQVGVMDWAIWIVMRVAAKLHRA